MPCVGPSYGDIDEKTEQIYAAFMQLINNEPFYILSEKHWSNFDFMCRDYSLETRQNLKMAIREYLICERTISF